MADRLAILCSGQGFQDAAMFDLVADAPEAAPVFEAARGALDGRDARDIARAGDDLHRNNIAQLLCCTQALAAWAVLKPRIDAPVVVAGYSVGELAAWGVAGVINAPAVLRLALARARAMDAAAETAPGRLAAVRGLPRGTIDDICARTQAHVAIVNAEDQFVIGGASDAVQATLDAAEKAGATKLTPLPVDVASHTPLLRAAVDAFGADLRAENAAPIAPKHRLVSGIDGEAVFDLDDGRAKLARQVAQTVDWAACMEACRAAGARRALELGPGGALARLMAQGLGERDSRSLADFRTLDGAAKWLAAS